MRDRASPAVIEHLEAENAFLEQALAPVKAERAKVLEELKSRIQPDDQSVPFLRRGYYYYRRFETGKEYPLFARRRGSLGAPEEILLDVNELALGHEFADVGFPDVSPDSTKLVYAADFQGRRFYDLYVKDLATGALIGEPIAQTTGDVMWADDNRTLFYAKQDPETLRACWVYRHALGSARHDLVFEETDEIYDVGLGRSRSGKFLYVVSSAKLSTEWRVLAANDPAGEFRVYLPREDEHEYSLEDAGDGFLILSNFEAQNFRLFHAPFAPTPKGQWREVVPHRADVLLEDVDCFRTHYVLSERANGQTRLAVVDRAGGARREIPFPDPVYVAGTEVNAEYDAPFVRYRYESLHRPASVFDYDFARGASELRKTQPVPGYDASLYESERVWATARDGTRVPISLVYRRGFARDGSAPLLVYGYGSYGLSMEPWFQSDVVSLLDRGFVYAMAHVRGGSEMGRAWYDDGKLRKKRNTFFDFIDATEFLVRERYGNPRRVYANGASAGGLLMGAVINERPDLYRGVIAGVPFVDVLTTMLDETIPLTTSEYDEWGDPREPEAYAYMATYSPYDNVRALNYPTVLATAGFHDSQVQYWEPAKWVAKLRKVGAQAYLFTEMGAGHGGASGRYEALEQTALEYAFLLWLEGQTK